MGILYVDYVKRWQRAPRTLRRLQHLEAALGEPISLYLGNKQVGRPDQNAIRIGGEDSDYGILDRSKGLVGSAASTMSGLKKGDALICRGAKIAKHLREAGASVPKCLRVLYVHDDPFPTSVVDNDFAIGWLKPHIVFALQPGRVQHYQRRGVPHAEWAYYGVDAEMFHLRVAPTKRDVAMASHYPTKIYQVRYDWMGKLAKRCDAVIRQGLTYAEYIDLLSSAKIAVDIPNSRQMKMGGAWSWMVNYRAFENAALGVPSLLPDLPGYRKAFDGLAHFYGPSYEGFERAVLRMLAGSALRLSRVARGREAVETRFSMRVATTHEARVIESMRGRT